MRKWFLVDQKKNWSTKKMRTWFLVDQKKNWSTKKMWNWPDNWSTKESDQKYMDAATSPVHVVLVSLLVDQLSGLFLIFFGRPKKNCPVSGNFWSASGNFWSVSGNFWSNKKKFNWPKKILVYQKEIWLTKSSQQLTKNSLRLDKFFLVDQKKWEKDRTIGRPRDWPKPHGRDYRLFSNETDS